MKSLFFVSCFVVALVGVKPLCFGSNGGEDDLSKALELYSVLCDEYITALSAPARSENVAQYKMALKQFKGLALKLDLSPPNVSVAVMPI